MAAYAIAADLYRNGLPQGVSFRSRLVDSANATTNTLTLNGHALPPDTAVQFTIDDGGVLPAPLALDTVYYAKPVTGSDSLLQIAATVGGAAIELTTAGTFPFRIVRSLGDAIDTAIEFWSDWVGQKLTGHEVPFTAPYPAFVVGAVAKLANRAMVKLLDLDGHRQLVEDADRIQAEISGMAASGLSLRDANATADANLATGASPDDTDRSSEEIP